MKTRAVIERGRDGKFSIFAPDIETGVIGLGSSVKEAKDDFDNSVKELIESAKDGGFPDELSGLEFEYHWDMASILNYFDWIKLSKLANQIGMDSSLLRHYKRGQYISDVQAQRILDALRKNGEELIKLAL